MTRILMVTLGETLPSTAPFDEKNIPSHKTPDEMAVFIQDNEEEIAFAESVLQNAPPGTKLRSHHREKSLTYNDLSTHSSIILRHTYIKTAGGISVQTERGDISIVGHGSFGKVKRMYTIPRGDNPNQPPVIVIKTGINTPNTLSDLDSKLTSILMSTEKPHNPFKSATEKTGLVEFPLWEGSDISVLFNAEDFNKEQSKKKKRSNYLSETLTRIKASDKPPLLELSPYLPMTLDQLTKSNAHKSDDLLALHLTLSLLKTMNQARHQKIIHRDIKPANILVNLEEKTATVIDWAMACRIPSDRDHIVMDFMGSPSYLPYELAPIAKKMIHQEDIPEIFPFLPYSQIEIPEDYIRKASRHYHYRYDYDTYSLGLCIRKIATVATPPITDTIQSLARLMTCYHPEGRFSLTFMHLAFFSLLWDEQQKSQSAAETDSNAFRAALAKEALPDLSMEMIREIKDILLITASIFQTAQMRSLTRDEPRRHESNQWTLLANVQNRLNDLIRKTPDLDALISLRAALTYCKSTICYSTKVINDSIEKMQFFEKNTFYIPFLLNSTTNEKQVFLQNCITILEAVFGNAPDKAKLIPHCLSLFEREEIPYCRIQLFCKEITASKDPALTENLKEVLTRHYHESTESPVVTHSAQSWANLFQTPTTERVYVAKQYTQEIEAALSDPFQSMQNDIDTLKAIIEKMNADKLAKEPESCAP